MLPLATNSFALPQGIYSMGRDGEFTSATLSPTLSSELEGPHLIFISS